MLEKTEGQRRRGWQERRWLNGIIDSMDVNLSKLQEIAEDTGAWRAAVHGVTKSRTWLSTPHSDGHMIFYHAAVTNTLVISLLLVTWVVYNFQLLLSFPLMNIFMQNDFSWGKKTDFSMLRILSSGHPQSTFIESESVSFLRFSVQSIMLISTEVMLYFHLLWICVHSTWMSFTSIESSD